MRPIFIAVVLAVILITAGYAVLRYVFPQPPALTTEQLQPTQITENDQVLLDRSQETEVEYEIQVFTEHLEVPWSLVFTSPDRLLVTERTGAVRAIINGTLQPEPLLTLPTVAQGESGVMGMTLDPDYTTNKFLYISYSYRDGEESKVRIARFLDEGGSIREVGTVVEGIPAERVHVGSRLRFGPDKKLYISTGDAAQSDLAQNATSLAGKILRVNTDGTIPADNPFPGSLVYTLGHRNPQGFDWHPVTGELYETEHGPSGFDGPGGGDEVNHLVRGANYGWPTVSHEKSAPGLISPLQVYTPAVAPASGTFYRSNVLPQFINNFIFGMLRGEGITRVVFSVDDPDIILFQERIVGIDVGRVRDVVEGPDGAIYFSTSNRDGRGTVRPGDDKIYRIVKKL